jgi:hypothetical protein
VVSIHGYEEGRIQVVEEIHNQEVVEEEVTDPL